jgi:hypothetical protein
MLVVQRANVKRKYLRILPGIILLVYAIVQLLIGINQQFDVYRLLPLKAYLGESFSIGYFHGWQVVGQGDEISVEPQHNWINDIIDPPIYSGSSLIITTKKATSSTSPGAGVEDRRAWEQGFSHYTSVKLPEMVIFGGSQWIQQAAIVEDTTLDGTKVTIEIMTLSTVHKTTDRPISLFTMTLFAYPTGFDQLNSQVWQPMLRSFVFR